MDSVQRPLMLVFDTDLPEDTTFNVGNAFGGAIGVIVVGSAPVAERAARAKRIPLLKFHTVREACARAAATKTPCEKLLFTRSGETARAMSLKHPELWVARVGGEDEVD